MNTSTPAFRPPADGILLAMANGYVRTQLLSVAAKLGIADHLAGGPRSADEIARATGTQAMPMRRVLRALASFGVVAEVEPDRFAITPLSQPMRSDAPRSVRNNLIWFGFEDNYLSVAQLEHTLRTGEAAFEHLYGKPYWDWVEASASARPLLRSAWEEFDEIETPEVMSCVDFGAVSTVVDVGSNRGGVMARILRAHPKLRGVLFDIPSALHGAAEVLESYGVADRCEIVPGDAFEVVVPGHDLYMLKRVIHDWDDESACRILSNCRRAMAPQGRVLVIERTAPERVEAAPGAEVTLLIDTLLLAKHPGARQRTEREFRELFHAAGLELADVATSPTRVAVLEGRQLATSA